MPKLLEKLLGWYHNALCHPRETCIKLSIARHFYWSDLPKPYMKFALKISPISF